MSSLVGKTPIRAVQVKHGKTIFEVPCPAVATILGLMEAIEAKSSIDLDHQKIIYKGKSLHNQDRASLVEQFVKFKAGKKPPVLKLVGSSQEAIARAENSTKDDPLMRSDFSSVDKLEPWKVGKRRVRRLRPKEYGFMTVEALPEFEDGEVAEKMLWELANNPGVQKVMEKHRWKVPVLKEMYPEGKVGISDVCLMGLNKNKGQEILLRIRTDDLKGFRKIESVFDVLYHELAHNEISPHNNAFKALNSQIKQEAHELDWTRTKGHRLGDVYTNRKVLTREEAISKLLGENDKEKKKDNKEDKKNGSGK
jgi:hypothetical protein